MLESQEHGPSLYDLFSVTQNVNYSIQVDHKVQLFFFNLI